MLKENRKILIITSIIILLPIIVGLVLWNRLPDQVATHWGVENEPNGWTSKGFTVFGMPLVMLALHWVCVFATTADPKRQNISSKVFGIIICIIPFTTLVVTTITYCYALGMTVDVALICCMLMGVIFVVLGNYLPKCKQNYTMGIRVGWALNDASNWNATHHFAGWVYTIGGIVIILGSLFIHPLIIFAVMLVLVFAPIVYSYIYYLRHK